MQRSSEEQFKHLLFGACALILFLSPVAVDAQLVAARSPITVSEARNLPQNSWVVLSGNIINALPGGINYTFRDSSGDITVEIDRRVWRGMSVGVSDPVEICGELRMNRGQISINVRAITGNGRSTNRNGQPITLTAPVTVTEARNLPHDSWVILVGNIINALPGGSQYTFRDASGEIIIEINQAVWRGLYIGPEDRVEINGEVHANRGMSQVEVRVIRRFP
ncbi:MAG: NirD/YgiW/YdeI family stress tolerance protein [Treponema sp.]|nr:NirD/YgiW/YdeI family stress tolerance protein [Treponema sp.]